MRHLIRSLLPILFALAASAATAHAWPTKPIKLIVPYAVGERTDVAACYIGDELAKELKQPIVVDNKPGAGGNVGTLAAAWSAPDGYTILIATNATHAATTFLYANPGYDARAKSARSQLAKGTLLRTKG